MDLFGNVVTQAPRPVSNCHATGERSIIRLTEEDVRVRTTLAYEICDSGALEACSMAEQPCSVNPHQQTDAQGLREMNS